ncbi:MAG: RES family NAD+ phosphorylase [Thermoanaerobaculales bacterium]
MQAWRLSKQTFSETAFDGEGARCFPGRWNQRGVAAVYVATTISLAALEYLAGVDPDIAPPPLVVIPVEFPEGLLVERIDPARLPRDWRRFPHPESTRRIGNDWLQGSTAAILSVPSAIIPQERIFVLNPNHDAFPELATGDPEPFAFDPRLW